MRFAKPIHRIAVVGTGVIGASWAALYLAKGFDVFATDPAARAESDLRTAIDNWWQALTVLGLAPEASRNRLRFTSDLRVALDRADFIQESGPERLDAKIQLFAEMDCIAPVDSIIASSSSGLHMSKIQSSCIHPERCVIGHPFNPPHLIPLVEVVGGQKTAAEAIDQVMRFYSSLGKRAIRLNREIAGHVGNRLQAALYREIVYLIEQGVLSVADADAAVSWGPGLRWGLMGPSLIFHLGGGAGGIRHFMDHLAEPMISWWKDLGNPELSSELREKIIDSVILETGNCTVDGLERARDEALLSLLSLRAKMSRIFPNC